MDGTLATLTVLIKTYKTPKEINSNMAYCLSYIANPAGIPVQVTEFDHDEVTYLRDTNNYVYSECDGKLVGKLYPDTGEIIMYLIDLFGSPNNAKPTVGGRNGPRFRGLTDEEEAHFQSTVESYDMWCKGHTTKCRMYATNNGKEKAMAQYAPKKAKEGGIYSAAYMQWKYSKFVSAQRLFYKKMMEKEGKLDKNEGYVAQPGTRSKGAIKKKTPEKKEEKEDETRREGTSYMSQREERYIGVNNTIIVSGNTIRGCPPRVAEEARVWKCRCGKTMKLTKRGQETKPISKHKGKCHSYWQSQRGVVLLDRVQEN